MSRFALFTVACGGDREPPNYDYTTASRLSRIGPSTFLSGVSCWLPVSFALTFSRPVRISPADIFPFLCA